MKQGNELAFPATYISPMGGLTKREYMAAAIFAGYCANPSPDTIVGYDKLAEWSVQGADALLKELAK